MTKLPFELCPTCPPHKGRRVSIVSTKGTKCYWCGTKVPHPEHPIKKRKQKRSKS